MAFRRVSTNAEPAPTKGRFRRVEAPQKPFLERLTDIPEEERNKTFTQRLAESAPVKVGKAAARGALELFQLPAIPMSLGQLATEKALGVDVGKTPLTTLHEDVEAISPEEKQTAVEQIPQRFARSAIFGPGAIVADIVGLGAKETLKAMGAPPAVYNLADISTSFATGVKQAFSSAKKIEAAIQQPTPRMNRVFNANAPIPERLPNAGRQGWQFTDVSKPGRPNAPKIIPVDVWQPTGTPKPISFKPVTNVTPSSAFAVKELSLGNPSAAKSAINLGERQIQQLDQQTLSHYDNIAEKLSVDAYTDPATFSARQAEEAIAKSNYEPVLNMVHSLEDEATAWGRVQEAIKQNFNTAQKEYRNLYNGVRKFAETQEVQPIRSRQLIENLQKKIYNVRTMAPGYKATGEALTTAQKDLGVASDLIGEGAQILNQPVTVDKLLDLAVRLGEHINYEALTPSIKELLKPVVQTLKAEAREALGKNPLALKAFNQAEAKFADTAERFGNDAIRAARSAESPEALISTFTSPTNVKNLGRVISGEARDIAERQILQTIANQSTDVAKKTLRQLNPFLSDRAKEAAQQLIRLGDKLEFAGQKALTQARVLEDVQNAVNLGVRPNFAMKTMQTLPGYKIVENALTRTPAGREVFNDMKRIFVGDIFESIVKENGTIDWSKAKDLIKNPDIRKVVRQISGEQGVNFLENLEKTAGKLEANVQRFAQLAELHPVTEKAAYGKQRLLQAAERAKPKAPKPAIEAFETQAERNLKGVKGKESLQRAAERERGIIEAETQRPLRQVGPSKFKEKGFEDIGEALAEKRKAFPKGRELIEKGASKVRPTEEAKKSVPQQIFDKMSKGTKALVYMIIGHSVSPMLLGAIGAYEMSKLFYRMMLNPNVQRNVKLLASPISGKQPHQMLNAVKGLNAALQEEPKRPKYRKVK